MTNLKNLLIIYGLLNDISANLMILIDHISDTEEFELIETMEDVNFELSNWIKLLIEFEPHLEELDLIELISAINNDFPLIEFDLNEQIFNLNHSDSLYGFMKLKGNLLNIKNLFKAKNFNRETQTLVNLINKSQSLINIIKECS